MTKQRDVDALAAAITDLVNACISRDQGLIGAHERASAAQLRLGDALRAVLGIKVEESAS
jgi:hypothetical protein